jgi:signal transduction histidine kinase
LEEEDYIKIVEEVINFNKILSLEKHIEIILEKAVCIPKIYVDARRIEQVLNNLIGNAVKFSGQDEKISVSVFCKR